MKIILFVFLVIVYQMVSYSQVPEELINSCSFCDNPECIEEPDLTDCSNTSPLWNTNSLYLPDENFEIIYIYINIILLHKDDGTGMFIEGNVEHEQLLVDWVSRANYRFANLENPVDPACYIPGGYLPTSKIQFIPNFVYINDEYGWNNESDVYPYCPSPPWYLDYLDDQIGVDPNIPKGINVYFTETSWYYESLIVNQTTVEPNPINNACSQYPTYNDLDRTSRIHFPNLYTKFWWMKNIAPSIYNQPWDPVIRAWYVASCGDLLAHEIGHSLWLLHDNSCEWNIMHQDPDNGRRHFFLNQIGKMHRSLSVTNVRKFTPSDTYISTPYVINENTVWDLDFTMYRDVIVEQGCTLSVTCKLVMKPQTIITIKPGGTLEVDGGIITTEDNILWKGIELQGDASTHQYEYDGPCAQGKLILKNGAVIENAQTGVLVGGWGPNLWNGDLAGGIIQVIGNDELDVPSASFINNERAVTFIPYKNFNPNDPSEFKPNRSYFNNALFKVDDEYIGASTWDDDLVWLIGVDGVSFKGCTFINEIGTGNNGVGIYCAPGLGKSSDCGFKVLPTCISQMHPCPDESWDRCLFKNLEYGIEANNTGIYTVTVEDAIFEDNSYGIRLSNVNNASILFNKFFLGQASQEEEQECGSKSSAYGIYMDNCTGFAIEENEFYKAEGAPFGNYTGISIDNTNAVDEVYKNYFEGLSYANYSEGHNWDGTYIYEGLQYLCNINEDNFRDIDVGQNDLEEGGIGAFQGNTEIPAGNLFTQISSDYDIYNNGNHPVIYYYCNLEGCDGHFPDPVYQVGREPVESENQCLSHYGGGGGGGNDDGRTVLDEGEKLQREQTYVQALSDYNIVKALYDDLKDGGNTEALVTDVETAWPSDMWELRAELLGKSPHLSLEVLKEAADKTDVLPESVLFEILSANPDELKKEELIKYLEDKENPLPEYMIDILKQVAMGTTYKTVLQKEMGSHSQNKTRAAHDMIRSLVNEEETDLAELRNWLDNLGGFRADHQIINTYLAEDNYNDALAMAGMLPGLYELEGNRLDEHNYYMDVLNLKILLGQENRSLAELTGDEVNQLNTIAENSEGVGGAEARGILEAFYGYSFCDCMNINDNQGYKSTSFDPSSLNTVYGISIEVKPNPAKEWTAFNYTLPDNTTKGVMKIVDITGKVVEVIEVTGVEGQYIWDTRKIKSGVYMYSFAVNGIRSSDKIVIQK